jgi:hypothetical protein
MVATAAMNNLIDMTKPSVRHPSLYLSMYVNPNIEFVMFSC